MTTTRPSRNAQLAAARRLVQRLRPATPGAWIDLSQEEHDARVSALRLAERRVAQLTTSRVLSW